MTVHDVTRHLFQPGKHYSGARMQQGRVLLDSDFNEHASIVAEDRRRALLDVVGPVGSSDDGFALDLRAGDPLTTRDVRFGGAPAVPVLDVGIRPGTLYLGGLRYELGARELAWAQRDFLSMRADDAPIAPASGAGRYLAWIEASEQVVSATEDAEILERALGGPDTTTRVRRLRRVRFRAIAEDRELSCEDAFATLIDGIDASYDGESAELRSRARLRIELPDEASDDACAPCSPTAAGRYLGAENQTIRVMLTARDRYVWGFDGGAPIHRVRIEGDRVTLATQPRDEHHWPVAGTVLELIPWGALLENGEIAAEPVGIFTRVSELEARTVLRIPSDGVTAWEATVKRWDAAHPDRESLGGATGASFAYARFWHRAETDAEVEIPVASGRALGRTGLVPRFAGAGRAGDHWLVSVRPADPERIVPWSLTSVDGAAPAGPRTWAAPLGVFRVEGGRARDVSDCRPRFRPLTEQQGCCTVTVGDGVTSFGDFTSIQRAIDSLPPSGGRVCVRPGRYREEVRIEARRDVRLEGCGRGTILETPDRPRAESVITLVEADRASIRDLELRAVGQCGVLAPIREGRRRVKPSRALDICGLRIETDPPAGGTTETRSAIEAHDVDGITIRDCHVQMDASRSAHAGLYVQGRDVLIERTRVVTEADERVPDDAIGSAFGATRASFAWGGIQIGGRSSRVIVRGCRVEGGMGHGITLGSVVWRTRATASDWIWLGPGFWWFDPRDPCPVIRPGRGGWVRLPSGEERYPISAGDLRDVEISENHVEGAATNGISVISTLLPRLGDDGSADAEHDYVSIVDLRVLRNRIIGNVRRPSADIERRPFAGDAAEELPLHVPVLVHGGVVLGEVVRGQIEGNRIELNGPHHRVPITGAHVLLGDALSVERNVIRDNGPRLSPDRGEGALSGVRGGLVLTLGGLGAGSVGLDMATEPTLRVRGNVIEQPAGPALQAMLAGPVVVEGNHLTSRGDESSGRSALSGAVLTLIDLGGRFEPAMEGLPAATSGLGLGGQVLLANNQIVLDWRSKPRSLSAPFGTVVMSWDDVRITANQWAMLLPGAGAVRPDSLVASVFATGASLHASANRFAEGAGDAWMSFWGIATWMATVAHNEATHCVISVCGTPRHVRGPNLELDTARCTALRGALGDDSATRWSRGMHHLPPAPVPPAERPVRGPVPGFERDVDVLIDTTATDARRMLRSLVRMGERLTSDKLGALGSDAPSAPTLGELGPAVARDELLSHHRIRGVELARLREELERNLRP